jgi:hypothetical protein
LTLTAFYAPAGHRATWFALMASLMNLALVAGALQTKYLNQMYEVGRGEYGELGVLLITVTAIGFIVPVSVILLFGRRMEPKSDAATVADAKAEAAGKPGPELPPPATPAPQTPEPVAPKAT